MDSSRPKIICHMMASIDGKITFGSINGKNQELSVFGEYMDLYDRTHEQLGTSWMCGRVTLEEFGEPTGSPLKEFSKEKVNNDDYVKLNEFGNFAISLDTKGTLRWRENYLYIGKEKIARNKFHLVTIVTKKTPKEYLTYLQSKNISYIFSGDDDVNFNLAMRKLKSLFKIDTILLEGGGGINGSMIDENLIDEISLLIIPKVINNVEAPALFYKKLQKVQLHKFKLMSVEKLERDVVWIRYKNCNENKHT